MNIKQRVNYFYKTKLSFSGLFLLWYFNAGVAYSGEERTKICLYNLAIPYTRYRTTIIGSGRTLTYLISHYTIKHIEAKTLCVQMHSWKASTSFLARKTLFFERISVIRSCGWMIYFREKYSKDIYVLLNVKFQIHQVNDELKLP